MAYESILSIIEWKMFHVILHSEIERENKHLLVDFTSSWLKITSLNFFLAFKSKLEEF